MLSANVVFPQSYVMKRTVLTGDHVSVTEVQGKKILHVEPQALTTLSENAFIDVAHLLRTSHLEVIGWLAFSATFDPYCSLVRRLNTGSIF